MFLAFLILQTLGIQAFTGPMPEWMIVKEVAIRLSTLAPRSTSVRLVHMAWGDGGQWDEAFTYFEQAWDFVLENLRRRFEHGPIDWDALGR